MLKGINPLLSGGLLKVLDEMGHADVLAVVDRNFPAYRYGKPVFAHLASDTETIAEALFSVFPVDAFVPVALWRMEIDNQPDLVTAGHEIMAEIASRHEGREVAMGSIERQEFYRQAERALAFIHTGETIPYSCFLISKGVV